MGQTISHLIIFLSPSGTTAKVAHTIRARLENHHQPAVLWNLAKHPDQPPPDVSLPTPGTGLCVWLGTPVYVNRALPPVLHALERLPVSPGHTWGVGFATYGAVTSGLALADLTRGFQAKGIAPIGMIKVVAQHSQFWQSDQPLGKGRPNGEDLRAVGQFVDAVVERLTSSPVATLSTLPGAMQTARMSAFAEGKSLDFLRSHGGLPATDRERCTQCGTCAQECPVGAISLSPWPIRRPDCIFCFRCIQGCPQEAWPFDPTKAEAMIRGLAQMSDEEHQTVGFL